MQWKYSDPVDVFTPEQFVPAIGKLIRVMNNYNSYVCYGKLLGITYPEKGIHLIFDGFIHDYIFSASLYYRYSFISDIQESKPATTAYTTPHINTD
jgi:hypothetical protein